MNTSGSVYHSVEVTVPSMRCWLFYIWKRDSAKDWVWSHTNCDSVQFGRCL